MKCAPFWDDLFYPRNTATDLFAEFKAIANYRPTDKVCFVTAAINIIRRILLGMGAEVIHLGHNRNVD